MRECSADQKTRNIAPSTTVHLYPTCFDRLRFGICVNTISYVECGLSGGSKEEVVERCREWLVCGWRGLHNKVEVIVGGRVFINGASEISNSRRRR